MPNFSRYLAFVAMMCLLGAIASPRAFAADGPIIAVVKFFPAEGREDEAQARLTQFATFVPKANPGVTVRLHRSTKGPTVFLLYETFPSQAALDQQPKTVHPAFFKEFGAFPQELFARPTEVEFYRILSD